MSAVPRRAEPLPPPLGREPFRTRDALALGVSPARLRRGDLDRPFRGMRTFSPPDDCVGGVDRAGGSDRGGGGGGGDGSVRARCRALAIVMDERHAFAHVTALRLLGAHVPDRLQRFDELCVLVQDPAARIRRPGVRSVARVGATRIVLVDGLRVTDPATTFVHLAAELEVEELVVLGDALTRRIAPLTDPVRLAEAIEGSTGCRGVGRARLALGLVVPGTDSVPETATRRLLERHGFPRPQVNVVVRDAAGAYLARPDLSYPELRIAIEYDGDYHRTDRRSWQVDVERRQRLEDAGWRILTVTAATLRNPTTFLSRLRSALTAAS